MTKNKIFALLLIGVFLVLSVSACSGNHSEALFGEIQFTSSGVTIDDLSFGYTQEKVMSKEGLEESDVKIRDIENLNTRFVVVEEPYLYDELESYGAQKTFTFTQDKLTGVAYNVAYRDVPHEDAYASAMGVYEKLCGLLEDSGVESVESGSMDSLDEVGGTFTRQWMLKNVSITLNMNYQDMSKADFTDMDQFNLSINITQAK